MLVQEYLDKIKEQLKSPEELIEIFNNGFEDVDDEEYEKRLGIFYQNYWDLILSSQNLALVGDIGGFIVFMLLSSFSQATNGADNESIKTFLNKAIELYNEEVKNG